MTDLSTTIAPKSNQANADDFLAGPRTVRITAVKASGNGEQPIAISFEGDDGKPYLPCKSMRRLLVSVWGADGHQYIGRSMTLYCDPKVKWGGIAVGGIRISAVSHIDQDVTLMLTESKAKRAPHVVKRLVVKEGRQQEQQQEAPTEEMVLAAIHRVELAGDMTAVDELSKLMQTSTKDWPKEPKARLGAAFKKRREELA